MTLCLILISPRTYKVIALCVWKACYPYSSEIIREIDLKLLPMSIVHLEAYLIYSSRARGVLLAVIAPESFFRFFKNLFTLRLRDIRPLVIEVSTLADQNNITEQQVKGQVHSKICKIINFHISFV